MNPMTLPLCWGNHMTGVVMVTMVTTAREAELSPPYTRARLHTRLPGASLMWCRAANGPSRSFTVPQEKAPTS